MNGTDFPSFLICCVPLETVEMTPTRKEMQFLCLVLNKVDFIYFSLNSQGNLDISVTGTIQKVSDQHCCGCMSSSCLSSRARTGLQLGGTDTQLWFLSEISGEGGGAENSGFSALTSMQFLYLV